MTGEGFKTFGEILKQIEGFVWGVPLIVLIILTGIYLTIRVRGLQVRHLGKALKFMVKNEEGGEGEFTSFGALCTALSATIGTGNIVGVATALAAGGPGALFWMIVAAFFGMATKYTEGFLAIKYRTIDEEGHVLGGPFYYIENGMGKKWKWLAKIFAFFGVCVGLMGIGTFTQVNGIASAVTNFFDPNTSWAIHLFGRDISWVVVIAGLIVTVCTALVIIGGIKRIANVSQVVVPFMAVFYVVAGLIVILGNLADLPSGIMQIFKMAFSFDSVTGGVIGAVVASMTNAMRYGVARGCFSNEAGMGSAAITAAAATTDNPVRQGYINMTGTFWDTIVVCTITGLVIAGSGVIGMTHVTSSGAYTVNGDEVVITATNEKDELETKNYTMKYDASDNTVTLQHDKIDTGLTAYPADAYDKLETGKADCDTVAAVGAIQGTWTDSTGNAYKFNSDGSYTYEEVYTGSALTIQAFSTVLGKVGAWLVTIGIALFAFSTILGWEYHGEKAFEYLFKTHKYNMIYRIVFSLIVYIGATQTLDLVWNFSDIANALMAIPNLICLLLLSGEIARDVKEFQKVLKAEKSAK